MKFAAIAFSLAAVAARGAQAQAPAPTASQLFTQTMIPAASLVTQWIEYEAVVSAAVSCKLMTEKELKYWSALWYSSLEVLISQRDQEMVSKEFFRTANSDKLEARVSYFLKTGCSSPELVAKVSDLKTRMRMRVHGAKQLDENGDKSTIDLYKQPINDGM